MKKLFLLTLAVIVYSTVAQGGIDFVGVDDVATTYDSGSETLSMVDTAVITVEYDDNTQFSIDPGSFSLISYYDSGMLFTGGTFVFTDESGPPSVILSGNVLSIQFQEVFGYLAGSGQAEVLVSNLAGYPLGGSEIVSITFNLSPTFTDFTQDYTGDSLINVIVPEPATLLLFGLGGLALRKCRK
jgi:hypothetical protein